VLLVSSLTFASHAQQYTLDPAHSAVTFQISHMGLSWTHGRFNTVSGEFSINKDAPEQSTFALTIDANSIDTGNQQRDDHLRTPEFFYVKEFPAITFQSTKVEPIKDGYKVTGNFTMHGVTKEVAFDLLGGRTVQFPPGTMRTGFSTSIKLKRSDFGVGAASPMLGDDVHSSISFEGTQK
jgi:polyisoprenoid-binding protein YceI